MNWLFTKRFRTFYPICRKYPNPSQSFRYSHSLNNQLNSSLRQIIVTHGRLWCSFSFLIKESRLRTSKFRTKKKKNTTGARYLWKPKYLHKSRLVPNLEFLYLSSEYSRKLLWDGFGKYLFRLVSIRFYNLNICSNWRFKCFEKKIKELFTARINCSSVLIFFGKFSTFKPELQSFFLIHITIFTHRRQQKFWKQIL